MNSCRWEQKGATTLMVTSVLLMVALAVTMGTHKATFYQIKRAQNEIKARQSHWLAEGAIECAYAQFRDNNKVPDIVTDCDSGQGVIPSFTPTSDGLRVLAKSGYSSVEKEILINSGLKSGAMQSSADLYFYSSAIFSTPDPGQLTADGWECVALRYKNRFYAASLKNQGVIHGEKPYQAFDNPGSKNCSFSNLTSYDSFRRELRDDFVNDSELSLFEQFFDTPDHEHDKVKQRDNVTVIEGIGNPKMVHSCGKAITNQIRSGKHYLWIEGGCEIKQSEYNELVHATANTDGVLILVHEGIFSVMGKPRFASSNVPFKGVLFHFNRDFVANPYQWRWFEANRYLNHYPQVVDDSYRTIASYYQFGLFNLSGGQYFDSPGQSAVFNDSLNISFNGDVVNSVQANINPPKWKQGSWYAE